MGMMVYNVEITNPRHGKLYANNSLSQGLQVVVDGVDVLRPNFNAGKFFFFAMIDGCHALKFLYYKGIPKEERSDKVRFVAETQHLLAQEGVTFDCKQEVVAVDVTMKPEGKMARYYGFITDAIPDPWNGSVQEPYINMRVIQAMHKACLKHNVWRPNLIRDLERRKNYSISSSGNVKYVDIDPKFYSTTCDESLKGEITAAAQFPYGRRNRPYQSVEEMGIYGIRNTKHRERIMPFTKFGGRTFLDIGCSLGGFCKMAKERNALRCVGIDMRKETIDVGSKLMAAESLDVELHQFDVNLGSDALRVLIGDEKFDYVFALSMLKHVDHKALFDIVNYYTGNSCWVEGHDKQTREEVESLIAEDVQYKELRFLGYTLDRGKRCNFEVIM